MSGGAGLGSGILRLTGHVMHYPWGSPRAIPELLGVSPDGRPWAELWLGAHPGGPARAVAPGGEEAALDELLRRDPHGILGPRAASAFGGELPFLFKVLAVAAPLSIQCHPDREQARAGFEREERAGIPRDAPERSYRDPNHKPELLVALTRFTALEGFRAPAAIRRDLEALGAASLAPELARLDEPDGERAIAGFFGGLMTLPGDRRRAALAEVAGATRAGVAGERVRRVRELLARYPGDVGALAPLYLELVELEPGEALFLPAQRLHCYLEGTALEVMAASDNVLRGGLTGKHVDVAELCRVLSFRPSAPQVIEPRVDGDLWVYDAPASEFSLAMADLANGAPIERAPDAAELLFCAGGDVEVRVGGAAARIGPGGAALVLANFPYSLGGSGRIWVVGIP